MREESGIERNAMRNVAEEMRAEIVPSALQHVTLEGDPVGRKGREWK